MAYTEYADKYELATREVYSSSAHNDAGDGIQAEFEDRMEAHLLNGVISGMAASISGTNILIASGEAYVEGKRYSGTGTVAFAALADNTYYVYVDPTDDVTPYKAKTGAPTSGEMVICQVTWATPTLSSLVDLRPWGIVPAQFDCFKAGAVTADQIAFFSVPRDKGFWIDGVCCWAVDNGDGGGPTLIDVLVGASPGVPATTIFTTTGYRPSMAHDLADGTLTYNTGYPEAGRKVAAGSLIIVEVDTAANNLADLGVTIFGRWC